MSASGAGDWRDRAETCSCEGERGEWCVRDGSCGACCLCTLDKQFDERKWEAGSWLAASSRAEGTEGTATGDWSEQVADHPRGRGLSGHLGYCPCWKVLFRVQHTECAWTCALTAHDSFYPEFPFVTFEPIP